MWTQQFLFNDIRILLIKGIAVISKLIEERTKRNPLSEVNPLIRGYDFFELLLRKFIILTILAEMCRQSVSRGEKRSVLLRNAVDKVFIWRNASTKCFSGEMRRPSVFWRNASTKCFSGELRRQSVFLEKCVDKAKFRLF